MPVASIQDFLSLRDKLYGLPAADTLRQLRSLYPAGISFSTSFSNEDQVITDLIVKHHPAIRIFTLDTGRLFKETYSVWSNTLEHYGITIEVFHPEARELEAHLSAEGPNAFYRSVALRKDCCHIRKVAPLKRALEGQQIWITGLRAEHSPGRHDLEPWEWDEGNNIVKYHPLLHWSTEEVNTYIRAQRIPYNILHDKGYVSIGCEPCTRAIQPGEAFRAGRWWWEEAGKKECGLHVKNG